MNFLLRFSENVDYSRENSVDAQNGKQMSGLNPIEADLPLQNRVDKRGDHTLGINTS